MITVVTGPSYSVMPGGNRSLGREVWWSSLLGLSIHDLDVTVLDVFQPWGEHGAALKVDIIACV